MHLLIGIVGRKRSGKDTLAGFIDDTIDEVNILSFADPIKFACQHAYHLRSTQLEETKDVIDPRWGITPRDMMKSLGGKYFRSQDPDHWVKNMGFRIQGMERVVISDVRYHNEASFIKGKGGILIHVWRDIEENDDDHVSEKTTEEIKCDYYIENDGSLEDLRGKLMDIIQSML